MFQERVALAALSHLISTCNLCSVFPGACTATVLKAALVRGFGVLLRSN